MQYELFQGDCVETMRAMPDNSVDSIVTDPPYELGFMGKAWDASGIANNPVMWAEALRVLKPGGHLLAFSGSRTYHRMTCAIEDAGFEVRDQIMWVYGSGFPKSLDVSKAIDKSRAGHAFDDIRDYLRGAIKAAGLTQVQVKAHLGYPADSGIVSHWVANSQPMVPGWADWSAMKAILPLDDRFDSLIESAEREKVGEKRSGIADGNGPRHTIGGASSVVVDITAPATDAARQWEGWGTALKPAHEPTCVARKPLIGTVAANVLQHGTGALNIDGCRVEGRERTEYGLSNSTRSAGNTYGEPSAQADFDSSKGRWPANLIHSGCPEVLALFPDSKGSGAARALKRGTREGEGWGMADEEGALRDAGIGSAARFFYQAKCPKTDRNSGLDGLVEVIIEWGDSTTGEIKWGTEARQVKLWAATGQSVPRVTAVFGAPNKSVTEWNTMLSGSAPTGLSPQDSTCTTSTKTSCTTPSEILSFFQSYITSESTADANCGTASGGSPAGNAASCSTLIFTTNEWMVSALGASRAVWPMRLKISVSAATSGHPTVKPTELMAYLCRLVTPPGGLILDPFMGSGSTGKAAMREGFRFIGCELSAEYLAIAEARISHELIGDLL